MSSTLLKQTWLAVGLQLLFRGRRSLLNLGFTSFPELLCNNITQVLKIFETLLESINSSGALYEALSASRVRGGKGENWYHTVGLNAHIHFSLGRVRNSVGAELHIGTTGRVRICGPRSICDDFHTHFFMIIYLKALPKVCPSSRNSKEAAVGVDPGSCRKDMALDTRM